KGSPFFCFLVHLALNFVEARIRPTNMSFKLSLCFCQCFANSLATCKFSVFTTNESKINIIEILNSSFAVRSAAWTSKQRAPNLLQSNTTQQANLLKFSAFNL